MANAWGRRRLEPFSDAFMRERTMLEISGRSIAEWHAMGQTLGGRLSTGLGWNDGLPRFGGIGGDCASGRSSDAGASEDQAIALARQAKTLYQMMVDAWSA
jgi:hypothetical protein